MRRLWIACAGLGLAGCLDFGPPVLLGGVGDMGDAGATGDAQVDDASPPDASLPDAEVPDASADMAPPVDDLTPLSTVFDGPASIAEWQTFNADGFRFLDAGGHHAGRLTLRPALGGWHLARTAGLLFVEIDGDFIIEADVTAGRLGDLTLPPSEPFNAAGLLIRDPTPGHEDWLLVGIGQLFGELGIEGKTTASSQSVQVRTDVDRNAATLRICRRGPDVYLLYRLANGDTWRSAWDEPGPLLRESLPDRLQAGLFANGWNSTNDEPATEGTPDLEAVFDAVRFRRPASVGDCLE